MLSAQDVPERDSLGSFPAPSWQSSADVDAQSEKDVLFLESENGRQVVYELLPKGQTDETWRKRHWVFVAEDVGRGILPIRNNFLNRVEADCAVGAHWADWDKTGRETVFVSFCGKRKSDGLGYLGVIWMGKKNRTLFRVSEEWRGAPYTFGQEETYFWDRRDLTDLVASIGSVALN